MKAKLTADEQDAFTGWRRTLPWRAGQISAIKAAFNRRQRRLVKTSLLTIVEERDGPEADFMHYPYYSED